MSTRYWRKYSRAICTAAISPSRMDPLLHAGFFSEIGSRQGGFLHFLIISCLQKISLVPVSLFPSLPVQPVSFHICMSWYPGYFRNFQCTDLLLSLVTPPTRISTGTIISSDFLPFPLS